MARVISCERDGGVYSCETLTIRHFLDSRFTDGGEVLSPMRRPRFTLQEDCQYSFLLEAESTPGVIMRLEGLGKLKESNAAAPPPPKKRTPGLLVRKRTIPT
jgi:hypothetical protein